MMRKNKIQKKEMLTDLSGKIIKKYLEINKNETIEIKQIF